MTRDQWVKVIAVMQANWPHAEIPDETIGVWYGDVRDLDVEAVQAAVSVLSREGREFPPTGGQIRGKVTEMGQAAEVDYATGWGLAMKAVQKFGSINQGNAMEWLEERSEVLAETVRRFGWKSLCMYDLEAESVVRAQFRDIFKSVQRDAQRDTLYAGLEAGVRPQKLKPRSIKEIITGETESDQTIKGLPDKT